MRFLFLLIVVEYSIQVDQDNSSFISSPGYPKPWVGTLPTVSEEYTVPHGHGTVILFREFLMSADDCVFMCTQDSTQCDSLCGDVMDHRNMKKILRVNSSAIITMRSISKPDYLLHSGIHGKILPLDLSNPTYFECGSVIPLSSNTPFFLVSNNYPLDPIDFSHCTVTFTSTEVIRFAMYDLITNPSTDSFWISGQTLHDGYQNYSLAYRGVTDDPFGLYFKQSTTVSFKYGQGKYYERGFFIIVDTYPDTAAKNNQCWGSGSFSFTESERIAIGTRQFGNSTYLPFENCSFNFTSELANYRLFLDIQYESEKCCDTMDISGIFGDEVGTFQGRQGRVFYFASARTISMHFMSDGIVQGPGFTGSVDNIDCSCGSTSVALSSTLTTFSLRSPGLQKGSPTYCPSLDCSWTISFPIDYDLRFQFSILALRSYLDGFDLLTITDMFNRTIKRSSSTNLPPYQLLSTSGPNVVSFQSLSTTTFQQNQMAEGFTINLVLQKKNVFTKNIVFNESYVIEDISTEAFKDGKNLTFESVVKARIGRRVTVYFFTDVFKMADIDIFDGESATASRMNNSELFYSVVEDGFAFSIRSTVEYITIRVRCNNDYGMEGQDFQALVTDIQQDTQSSCGSLVHTLRKNAKSENIQMKGDCLKILHVTSSSYDPLLAMTVRLDQISSLNVYKGIRMTEKHRLLRSNSDMYPSLIYDRYLIVQSVSSDAVNLVYDWIINGLETAVTVNGNEQGFLMSYDYLPYLSPKPAKQQFSIELTDSGKLLTGIQLQFFQSIGNGSATLEMKNYDDSLWKRTFTGGSSKSFQACGTKLLIRYTAPAGENNGLYAKYQRGSLQCSSHDIGRMSFIASVMILLYVLE